MHSDLRLSGRPTAGRGFRSRSEVSSASQPVCGSAALHARAESRSGGRRARKKEEVGLVGRAPPV